LVLTLLLYQELDLSGLGVTSVPAAAWETSDVVKLDLSKNSIEDLPNELSLCSSLQVSFLERKYCHIFLLLLLSCLT
jgi:Leucine-rich repeat (LRR) protein